MELEQVATATVVDARPSVEDQFIERLKRSDPAAFEKLVNERSGEIYGLLYRLTENTEEARDLTQETFLRAFQSIGQFRGESDLRTWIYRIAINQARNRWRWWRRRHRDATVSIDAADANGNATLINKLSSGNSSNPEHGALAHERERALRKALSGLRRVYREAVVLRDIEGFSYNEIADVLGVSIGTVKSRLARARGDLKKSLMRYLSVQHLR
jgi:RNA polymerase sigma-70 factor (ECF subfamily)